MDDRTKAAYRHVLYVAVLAIRGYCPLEFKQSWSPLAWRRRYRQARLAGAVADWLHNLAHFSAVDFAAFDEHWFWRDHANLCRRFPADRLERYREVFDEYRAGHQYLF